MAPAKRVLIRIPAPGNRKRAAERVARWGTILRTGVSSTRNGSACDGTYPCDGHGRRNVSPLVLGAMPDTNLVLVIDDEPQIRRAVRDALRDVAARVDEAADGAAGVAAATEHRPDLIVLDLGLPDVPGVEVCRQIRRRSAVPIIVLSARHSEHEKVDLLNAGADDYVTKPFSVLELAARARAQIRRARSFASSTASATRSRSADCTSMPRTGAFRAPERRSISRRSSGRSWPRCSAAPAARSRTSRYSTPYGIVSSAVRSSISAFTSPTCAERSKPIRRRRRSSSRSPASVTGWRCLGDPVGPAHAPDLGRVARRHCRVDDGHASRAGVVRAGARGAGLPADRAVRERQRRTPARTPSRLRRGAADRLLLSAAYRFWASASRSTGSRCSRFS